MTVREVAQTIHTHVRKCKNDKRKKKKKDDSEMKTVFLFVCFLCLLLGFELRALGLLGSCSTNPR
jgi:hypothetical protein